MNKTVKTKTQVKVPNNLEAHYTSHCRVQARYSSRFLSPPASPIFFTAPSSVFATGESVRPEPGQGRMAACRPVRSFSKVDRQVEIKDEDGRHSVVPSHPGLLAVPPPGPTGAPDDCEHCPLLSTRGPSEELK